MQQFKNTSLILLFYEIIGWLMAQKLFPKKIEFWKNEDDDFICANVYYCNDQIKPPKQVIDNKRENDQKRFNNSYPTIDEHIISDSMELTDLERSYVAGKSKRGFM